MCSPPSHLGTLVGVVYRAGYACTPESDKSTTQQYILKKTKVLGPPKDKYKKSPIATVGTRQKNLVETAQMSTLCRMDT
jgi:hypothetical protein